MRRFWWTTWIKVAAVAAVLLVAFFFGKSKLDHILSPYESDGSPEQLTEDANIIDKTMYWVEKTLGKKLNYEDLIFDYANDYAQKMMTESKQSREPGP